MISATPTISFDEAIAATTEDRDILLGNGFSRALDACYSYQDIFSAAQFDAQYDGIVRAIFAQLKTVDFEEVAGSISRAAKICKIILDDVDFSQVEFVSRLVQAALQTSLVDNHIPSCSDVLEEKILFCREWLRSFKCIFSLNFDLLLYWVAAKSAQNERHDDQVRDGFGHSDTHPGLIAHPSSFTPRQNLFYLHGAMHLMAVQSGTQKLRYSIREGLIRDQAARHMTNGKFPLVVVGGSADQKLATIESYPYLKHCFDAMGNKNSTLFVFGFSPKELDRHIITKLSQSKNISKIYWGVFCDDDVPLAIAARNSVRDANPVCDFVLFDSSSTHPWGELPA